MKLKGIIIFLLFILTLVPFQFFETVSTFQTYESINENDFNKVEILDKEIVRNEKQNQDNERHIYVNADDQYLYQDIRTSFKKLDKDEVNSVTISTLNHQATDTKLTTPAFLINVPLIAQNPELPRGCEVTSLAMLLNHAGIAVDKMTLAEQIKKVPFEENELKGNPNDGFVGSMYTFDQPGLGVYHVPIFELAEQYLPNRIIDLTGSNFEEILKNIDSGKPIWVIANTWYSYVPETYWYTWKTSGGDIQITYKEHSVVLTGYDETHVYFNDPLAVIKDRRVLKREFEKAYNQMGKQAITYID